MAEKKASGRLRTPEEIKKELARRGETIADLARRHGLNPG
jgi:transposase-like protein